MPESQLSRAFRAHGRRVARCPVLFLALPLAAAAVLAAGLAFQPLQVDTDANKIWVPPGSTTAQQKAFFDAAFDPFFRVNQVILSLADEGDDARASSTAVGILEPEFLQAAFTLQQQLLGGVSRSGVALADVCFRPIPGKGCLVETPLDFFKSNSTVIGKLSATDIQQGIACRAVQDLPGIPCQNSIGVPVQADVVLGGARCASEPIPGFNSSVCGGCAGTYADALVLTFLLQAAPALTNAGAEWEQDVFLPAVANFSRPGLRVSYMAERSISDELTRVDNQNQGVVVLSYGIMLLYVVLALGKTPHPVASRALLGVQGIMIVALSVAGAMGVAAWSGLHVTMLCLEVVPFLILAIGVDNVFILVKAVDREWAGPVIGWKGKAQAGVEYSADTALAEALAEVGPTITAAALGEVAAFTVGITTNIPALRQFCIIAAIAVSIDYVLQLTWFAAATYLDLLRQEAGRADVLPCLLLRRTRPSAPAGYEYASACTCAQPTHASSHDELADTLIDAAADRLHTAQGANSVVLSRDIGLLEGYGAAFAQANHVQEGEVEGSDDSWSMKAWRCTNRGGFVRDFLSKIWSPFSLWFPVRMLIILVWLGFLSMSVWAAGQLQLGLEQQLVLPTGSYLSEYFTDQAHLGDAGPPMYVVLQNVNYSHPNATMAISTLASTLASKLPDVLVPPVFSWVGDFETWGSPTTRNLIASNPSWGCPLPLDPSTSPLAARVAQFVYGVPIDSYCCQGRGYCGGQYASDIKFLWGLPKSSAAANTMSISSDGTPDPAVYVTKTGRDTHVRAVRTDSIGTGATGMDDGGCDLVAGYLTHTDMDILSTSTSVAGSFAHPRSLLSMGERVHVPSSALPMHMQVAMGGAGNATLIPCHILTSRLRGQHTPLRNQSDFITAMQKVQSAVDTLQAALLPVADLSLYGIQQYGQLQPGAAINGSAWTNGSTPAVPDSAYGDDNAHTTWLPPAPGGAAFPYSLIYVYYEQYGFIRAAAVANMLLAVGAVFVASLLVTSPVVACVTTLLVASVAICMAGWVWLLNPHGQLDPYGGGPYGVDINAVSVVNAVTATGLSVEFIVHIASAYFTGVGWKGQEDTGTDDHALAQASSKGGWCSSKARGRRTARAKGALVVLGAPVVTGITLTKLIGVLVLATAPSALFRLYYFRMYLGIIVLGAFHGLVLLPSLLAG